MANPFFDHPILNSPYDHSRRHCQFDEGGQPTHRIIASRDKTFHTDTSRLFERPQSLPIAANMIH